MDFSSFRWITLRACSLHDEAIFHEVHHRWRRASSTPASSVIQNDFVAILQAAGLCTPPQCATTQPHSSAIHQDERTLFAVLLSQHHVREVINNPAQGDAERGSEWDWRDRNCLMHAGASGVVNVNRVKYGEVGSAVRLSAVPAARDVEDVK